MVSESSRALSTPTTVSLVRVVVGTLDDAVAAAHDGDARVVAARELSIRAEEAELPPRLLVAQEASLLPQRLSRVG